MIVKAWPSHLARIVPIVLLSMALVAAACTGDDDDDDGGTATSPTGNGTQQQETTTPGGTETADEPSNGDTAELEITAVDLMFDKDTLTAPAGSEVSITLINEDNVPHNIAFYESDAATEEIFVGTLITGPDEEITETFTAPEEPGDYFFRCDVHPDTMTGTFVVE